MVAEQPGGKHKRGAGVATRARKRITVASLHAVPAVNPSTNPSASDPAAHPAFAQTYTSLGSLVEKGSGRTQGASDVWYFVRGLHSIVQLDTLLEKETLCEKRPDSKEFSHLGCRLCTGEQCTTWKNAPLQPSAVRNHNKLKHGRHWRDIVLLQHLNGWEKLRTSNKDSPSGAQEAFSLVRFYNRLTKWMDDQSLDVVDCPELRDLLLFIGAQLADHDIPHGTKLSEMITTRFKTEYNKMIEDIDSRQNLESYMAVTTHYCAKSPKTGNLILKSQLVAFCNLQGSHTGVNIGKDLRTQTNTSTAISTLTRHTFVAPSASRATTAQASGHARLSSLVRSLPASSLRSPPLIPLETPIPTEAEKEEAEHHAAIEDEGIVDRKLMNYEMDGVIDQNHSEFEDFNILRYWQSKQGVRPLLWKITLDVLPVLFHASGYFPQAKKPMCFADQAYLLLL